MQSADLGGTQSTSGEKDDSSQYDLVTIQGMEKAWAKIVQSNLEITQGLAKMDVEASKVIRTFGYGMENAKGIKDAFVEARDGVIRAGGTMKDVFDNQAKASAAVGRSIVLSAKDQENLTMATRVTGVEAGKLVTSFKDVGMSIQSGTKAMADSVNVARAMGVSATEVSKKVTENIGYLNQYNFQGGVEGLAKMAAQAISLRIDMKDIMGTVEKAFNPDSAIQMAASLQRLGVAQSDLLDPLRLMNLAENDPAELQNQIAEMSKSFVRLNEQGNFEILPGAKRRMREIEKALGMSTGSLAKMALSSAELDEKMKRIKFPEFMSEEQKKMLANVSEMKDGVVKITVSGKEMNLDEALANAQKEGTEGINKLLKEAQPKTMEQLNQDQLNVLEEINIGINLLTGIVPASLAGTKAGEIKVRDSQKLFRELYKDIPKTTELRDKFGKNLDEPAEKFSKAVDGVITGKGSMEELKTALAGLTLAVVNTGKDIFVKAKETVLEKMGGIGITPEVLSQKKEQLFELLKEAGITLTPQQSQKLLEELSKNTSATVEILKKAFEKVTNANDFLYSNDRGLVKFDEKDTIIGGTGLDKIFELMSKAKPTNETQGVDFSSIIERIQTISPKTKTTETNETIQESKENTLNLNIKIDAPQNIDTNKLIEVLKNQFVTEQIMQSLEKVSSNNGLIPRKK